MNLKSLTPYQWIEPGKGPAAIYTAEQSKAIDADCIKNKPTSGFTLMKNAGYAAYSCLRAYWPNALRITILCGTGNNGGDGFILAHHLSKDANVQILVLGHENQILGTAQKALRLAQKSGISIIFTEGNQQTPPADNTDNNHAEAASTTATTLIQTALNTQPDLWVDAIMGIGLNRAISPKLSQLIHAINQQPTPVFSLDIPTGIAANSGLTLGAAVKATITITFIVLKQGLFRDAGKAHTGKLALAPLGVSQEWIHAHKPSALRINYQKPMPLALEQDTHKGKQGTLVCIGGNIGMPGAILLAAETALHTGVGKVFLATHSAHHMGALARRPELMLIDFSDKAHLVKVMKQATAILIGPGLGQDETAEQLLEVTLKQATSAAIPLLLDADALNIVAKALDKKTTDTKTLDAKTKAQPTTFASSPLVMTPHLGEAKRLLPCAITPQDPFSMIQMLSKAYCCTLVLKGAGTLIQEGEKNAPTLCDAGNASLAKGGMGDVLSGVIAGLLAQSRMTPLEAARFGVWLHAKAADQMSEKIGAFNVLPSSLATEIGCILSNK